MKRLIRLKVYFDRARMYISYAQTAVVCLTAIKVFGIKLSFLSGFLWTLAIISACLFVGWLDCKMGLMEAEQKRVSELNPILIQILNELKRKNCPPCDRKDYL